MPARPPSSSRHAPRSPRTPTRRASPAPREPTRLLCFNKPYGVLSQFTPEGRWQGLQDFIAVPGVYVAGRLDADSEGLLLLTNDGALQARIADPRHKMAKTYRVQVEGVPSETALQALRDGVPLNTASLGAVIAAVRGRGLTPSSSSLTSSPTVLVSPAKRCRSCVLQE